MPVFVADPYNAFLEGKRGRIEQQNAERKNALLDMELQNAPAMQERQNRLLDLQAQGAEQTIASNKQRSELEQQKFQTENKNAAITQLSNLAREAKRSSNPRQFVAQAASNPLYGEIFKQVGMDPRNIDPNSPSFDSDLDMWASLGPQVSPDAQFNRETAQINRESDRAFQEEKSREQREFTAEQNRLSREATLDAAGARADAQAQKQQKSQSAGLRKEFRGLQSVKDYEATLPLIESAKKAPDTRQGDLQLIYTVGKVFDPGSVVREGELKLTAGAAPFLQQLAGRFRGELGKGRLTPQTRAELIQALEQRQSGYRDAYTRDYDTYSQYATDSGSDPFAIVGKRPETAYAGQGGASPPREVTATGPNGEKIVLRNGQWVPLGR